MGATRYAALLLALFVGAVCAQEADEPEPGEKRTNETDGAEMVWVPGGEFEMGSAPKELDELWARTGWDPDRRKRADSESPKHTVEVDGFWMYATEVTNEQYGRFVEATAHREPLLWEDERFNGPEQPVVGVSWEDAEAYCKWAGGRLPTEAEWEYAARCGDDRIFPWGNESLPKTTCGNFADKSTRRQFPRGLASKFASGDEVIESVFRFVSTVPGYEDGYSLTAPVGSFPANDFGLHDLSGNVWEWCEDWHAKYPGATAANDVTIEICRVVRGGSFINDATYLRCAYRNSFFQPDHRSYILGFRCVLEPDEDPEAEGDGGGDGR